MGLSQMFEYDPKWEQEIIWVDPEAKKFSYLREETNRAGRRVAMPVRWKGRYVAYATLKPNAPSISRGVFERRVWYVQPRDLGKGGSPIQSVDPTSIIAGRRSRRGSREDPA
jgi:hypothetical protein